MKIITPMKLLPLMGKIGFVIIISFFGTSDVFATERVSL